MTTTISGQDLLTHSRRSAFMTCRRKAFYAYELGIRKDVTAKPLRMGSAMHRAWDLHARGWGTDEAIEEATKDYDAIPAWAQAESDIYDWQIEGATCRALLRGYFWRWQNDPIEYAASEKSFELPILNPDTGRPMRVFRQAGQIDGIGVYDGRKVVIEHKTTSDDLGDTSDYWWRLRMDGQVTAYLVAAREEVPGVEAVLYDVVRKPTIRPRAIPMLDGDGLKIVIDNLTGSRAFNKNGTPRQSAGDGYTMRTRPESPDEFALRLDADIQERPEFYFARRIVERTDAEVAEFKAELHQIASDMHACRQTNRWFRNTGACLVFGRCAYFDICPGFDMDHPTIPQGFTQMDDVHPELTGKDEE